MRFEAGEHPLPEGNLPFAADDEHDSVETGAFGIENGIIQQGLAMRPHAIGLFGSTAVAAAHSGGENEEGGHGIMIKLVRGRLERWSCFFRKWSDKGLLPVGDGGVGGKIHGWFGEDIGFLQRKPCVRGRLVPTVPLPVQTPWGLRGGLKI